MKRLLQKLDIHNGRDVLRLFGQFLKFGIVGLSNTFLSLAIYYLFLWIDVRLYLWGNLAGWLVSVANAFFWNSRYVFRADAQRVLPGLLKSYLAYGSTFLLSIVLLYLQVEFLGISEVIAPIINVAITTPLNFLVNKFWTFRSKKGGLPQ